MPTRTVPSKTQLAKDANSRKLLARLSALKVLAARKLAAINLDVEPSTTQSLNTKLTSESEESNEDMLESLPSSRMAPEPTKVGSPNLRATKKSDPTEPYRGHTPNSMAPKLGANGADTTIAMEHRSPPPPGDFGQIISAKNVSETIPAPEDTLNGSSKEIPKEALEPLSDPNSTFGPISFPVPLNADCTFENALYPFKLVLSPAEERPLETVEIWIATCPSNAIAAVFKYIRFIYKCLVPLDIEAGIELKHLRRLRKIREYPDGPQVLEVVLCGSESICRQELGALLWSNSEDIPALRPRLALASKWAAYTLQQYEKFSTLWPVTMRTEAKRRIARVPTETSEMQFFMAAVMRLSQRVYLKKDKGPHDLPIATLIVDPVTSRIIASTYDTRVSTGHPLNHSVLTAINLLAMSPLQRNSRDAYYASGYDFYTTHEPCVMCCMAMVHSRARRCVFWREMRYTGGKGMGWKKELNHKYMCFQWIGDETVAKGVVEDVSWDVCA